MKNRITFSDYMKAIKSADRDIDQEIYGVGFKSRHKVHKTLKGYTRKIKHKGHEFLENN